MIVTQEEYDAIRAHREQLLNTPQGRKVLCRLLSSMGLFQSADRILTVLSKDPAAARPIIQAIGILESMGVWNKDTFMDLLEQMAKLPMPQVGEQHRGETA